MQETGGQATIEREDDNIMIRANIVVRRRMRLNRDPEDRITHRDCPRCSGRMYIGEGTRKYLCQFFGYNKKHRGGEG